MSGLWPFGRWPPARGRMRGDLLVLAGLAAFVCGVYLVVVVGVGLLVSWSESPSTVLSVAGTTIVAVSVPSRDYRRVIGVTRGVAGGRYWVRTSGLFRVSAARLSQRAGE